MSGADIHGLLPKQFEVTMGEPRRRWRIKEGHSLYERANGYNYDAVKVFMSAGAKEPVYAHYTEHIPADVTAAFIWLKNRDPECRDTQNVEHVLGRYIISDTPMTEEQWIAERATVIDEKVVEELPAPESERIRKRG